MDLHAINDVDAILQLQHQQDTAGVIASIGIGSHYQPKGVGTILLLGAVAGTPYRGRR